MRRFPYHRRKKRYRPRPAGKPQHTLEQILAWADSHRKRTGRWPIETSGPVAGTLNENWRAVDRALRVGVRGLPGGSSLARLLAEHRNVRNLHALPPYTIDGILRWADAHHADTGQWPGEQSGPIAVAPGETWKAVGAALKIGRRGLPGGTTLTRLLEEHRGLRNPLRPPPLTVEQILEWADAHHAATGAWPGNGSGVVANAAPEKWSTIDCYLKVGRRGLPGGTSLARLLLERRGVRTQSKAPPLSLEQVLAWADAHHARTGAWPGCQSGPIPEAPGESWSGVTKAMQAGLRGVGRYPLGQLLLDRRAARVTNYPRSLTRRQVLAWADAYRGRTGAWPTKDAGPIAEAPETTWSQVAKALTAGWRGLRGRTTLARLLAARRGWKRARRPPLTMAQILTWADAWQARTDRWPTAEDGLIPASDGETWEAVNHALRAGYRGLPGGQSLTRLLAACRGAPNRAARRTLTPDQIRAWADTHRKRTGRWPTATDGRIVGTAAETWRGVDHALRDGGRGLPGGSSLHRLLQQTVRPASSPTAKGSK